MNQDVYFPQRPSLEQIQGVYKASSFLLISGVIVFGIIFVIAVVAIAKVLIHLQRARHDQKSVSAEMQIFYKKQLKLLQWKEFLHSLYNYVKLLSELHQWKSIHSIWYMLGYDTTTIQYIEKVVLEWKEVDYEQEKRIKEVLHTHIQN